MFPNPNTNAPAWELLMPLAARLAAITAATSERDWVETEVNWATAARVMVVRLPVYTDGHCASRYSSAWSGVMACMFTPSAVLFHAPSGKPQSCAPYC